VIYHFIDNPWALRPTFDYEYRMQKQMRLSHHYYWAFCQLPDDWIAW